ncbi:MAG: DNA repair protein RecN [Cyanobacteria bacterium J06642_2]
MLSALRIENFALVETLELEFSVGLNVLTGETGAGKSIILDAIDAALGGPVSEKSIRTGRTKAVVEATFTLTDAISAWLAEYDIDPLDEGLICTREITLRDKPGAKSQYASRSRVNGVLANKQQMRSLRQHLAEITAQGQTTQLQDAAVQRQWLDGFAGAKALKARDRVRGCHRRWAQAKAELELFQQQEQNRWQQLDMLQFQHRELDEAALTSPTELEDLLQERQRLSHSVELQQQSHAAYQMLYQSDSGDASAVADLLGQVERSLQAMSAIDSEVSGIAAMVSDALIQVEEAGRALHTYGDALDSDPECLERIEERIVTLKQLCRKYGPTLADVLEHAASVSQSLLQLEGGEASVAALEEKRALACQDLEAACERLTDIRQRAGDRLTQKLVAELKPLAMQSVQFAVQLDDIPLAPHGRDGVTFLLSPNPGEPLQPLATTASGGEMSRFLLALKAVFSQVDAVETSIFDEIDVGVSGKVAQAIAQKLHEIARTHQVLCVTHQPLVAAMADRHLNVRKETRDRRTVVCVRLLSHQERRKELAQLAGGQSEGEALAFADALLTQAERQRGDRLSPSASRP